MFANEEECARRVAAALLAGAPTLQWSWAMGKGSRVLELGEGHQLLAAPGAEVRRVTSRAWGWRVRREITLAGNLDGVWEAG